MHEISSLNMNMQGWDVGETGIVSGSPSTLSLNPVTMLGTEPELKPKSLISYWRSLHTSPHKKRAFGMFTTPFLNHELIQNRPLRQTKQEPSNPLHRWESSSEGALEGHTANRTDSGLWLYRKMPKPPALDLWWDWERKKITVHKSYTFLWTLWLLQPIDMWERQRKLLFYSCKVSHTYCRDLPLCKVRQLSLTDGVSNMTTRRREDPARTTVKANGRC